MGKAGELLMINTTTNIDIILTVAPQLDMMEDRVAVVCTVYGHLKG